MISEFVIGFVSNAFGITPTKAKFRKLQHLKCVRNDPKDAPNLLIDKLYSARAIYDYTSGHGPDAWGVQLWGDEKVYHHSYFEPSIGPIRGEDFAHPLTQRIESRSAD